MGSLSSLNYFFTNLSSKFLVPTKVNTYSVDCDLHTAVGQRALDDPVDGRRKPVAARLSVLVRAGTVNAAEESKDAPLRHRNGHSRS